MHHNWIAIVVAIVAGLASGLFAVILEICRGKETTDEQGPKRRGGVS